VSYDDGDYDDTRAETALILIEHEINPPLAVAPQDPNVLWAKTLLKDILT